MNNKPKLVIIDYSSLLYSACYNTQIKEEHTDNFKEYKTTLDFYIESILLDTKIDYYIVVGDDYTSFRKEKYPDTKSNRKGRNSMKFFKELKEYAIDKYNVVYDKILEADDICLILQNKFKKDFDIVIASKDSDLRQQEGTFYNYGWRKELYKKSSNPSEKEIKKAISNAYEYIKKEDADFTLWKNILIKGHNNKTNYLEGCGKVTAISYLEDNSDVYDYDVLVMNAFVNGIKKGKSVKRGVKGYGYLEGLQKLAASFEETYLLRSEEEANKISELNFNDITYYKPKVESIPIQEEESLEFITDDVDIDELTIDDITFL